MTPTQEPLPISSNYELAHAVWNALRLYPYSVLELTQRVRADYGIISIIVKRMERQGVLTFDGLRYCTTTRFPLKFDGNRWHHTPLKPPVIHVA